MTASAPFRVRVPASAAHLGPGFDLLALALALYYEVQVEPEQDGGLRVESGGQLRDLQVAPDDDLLVRGLRAVFARRDAQPPALLLRATSEIPVARGLGSSAAALLAGTLVGERLLRQSPTLDERARALEPIEGHYENLAAALTGGLVAAVTEPDEPRDRVTILPLELHDAWKLVVVWPGLQLAASAVRRLLPATVRHGLVARSTGRTLLLLRGLRDGDPELLARGLRDEVHVPYQARAVPGLTEVFEAASEAGAAGATLAGSGPAAIAFVHGLERGNDVLMAMCEAFQKQGMTAAGRVLEPAVDGARILPA